MDKIWFSIEKYVSYIFSSLLFVSGDRDFFLYSKVYLERGSQSSQYDLDGDKLRITIFSGDVHLLTGAKYRPFFTTGDHFLAIFFTGWGGPPGL